jgi:hypothetical protein
MTDDLAADFAYEAAVQRERAVSLEEDAAIYRLLAVAALDAVHMLTRRNDRLRDERDRLRDELRALREQCLLRAGADEDAA